MNPPQNMHCCAGIGCDFRYADRPFLQGAGNATPAGWFIQPCSRQGYAAAGLRICALPLNVDIGSLAVQKSSMAFACNLSAIGLSKFVTDACLRIFRLRNVNICKTWLWLLTSVPHRRVIVIIVRSKVCGRLRRKDLGGPKRLM